MQQIAVGGMAELHLATAPGEHGFAKRVVVKRLLPQLASEPSFRAMFIDEANLTARLSHPKIVQTYELGQEGDTLYIVMEYVDGIDALTVLREFATQQKKMPPHLAVSILTEVLDALDYAHGLADSNGAPLGIVHRDISPSNILLSRRGDVKLIDFGIARAADPSRNQRSEVGTLKGKYGYMSPEQVLEQPIDGRSDLFSVGVVLAEMLTGRRLFAAANELDVLLMVRDVKLARLEKYGTEIPPDLAAIVRKALKKEPSERWASASAFRDALMDWLFEHRHRVMPKHIAEMVMQIAPAPAETERAVTTTERPAVRPPVMARPTTDSVEIDLTITPPKGVPILRIEPAPDRPKQPAQLKIAPPAPAKPNAASGLTLRVPDLAPPSAGPDLSPLDADESINYSSIEAAIESLMPNPVPADPSAIDFNDEVLGGARNAAPPPLPTPAEVAKLAQSPPPALAAADDSQRPDETGEFQAIPALTLFYRLFAKEATGLLRVNIGGIRKDIYFRDGHAEHVSSNVSSELFGNYLVSKNVLTDGELAMALAMMPHYSGKLGDTLVGLGLLKPLEVFRHLTKQVRSKLVDVCTWTSGSYAWFANMQNTMEAFPLDLNNWEVLGAGAMEMPGNKVMAWAAPRRGQLVRRTRAWAPEKFELGDKAHLALLVDGHTTVGDLLDQGNDEAMFNVGRIVFLLQCCEMVVIGDARS